MDVLSEIEIHISPYKHTDPRSHPISGKRPQKQHEIVLCWMSLGTSGKAPGHTSGVQKLCCPRAKRSLSCRCFTGCKVDGYGNMVWVGGGINKGDCYGEPPPRIFLGEWIFSHLKPPPNLRGFHAMLTSFFNPKTMTSTDQASSRRLAML